MSGFLKVKVHSQLYFLSEKHICQQKRQSFFILTSLTWLLHIRTLMKHVKFTSCFVLFFIYTNLTGHKLYLSTKKKKQERERNELSLPKSLGQTLMSPSKVAARWFIFKQVIKLQILIRAVDSSELFLQIFFVVKRGHLSKFV